MRTTNLLISVMFSSHKHLQKKTPSGGIGRRDFIEHLVEEYYTTTNLEAQEQVTANLANFAYDPINWKHLKEKQALQVFIELLTIPNERLQLHGVAGLCNICHDSQACIFIAEPKNFAAILQLFVASNHIEITLNLLTLFYQLLLTPAFTEHKRLIINPEILKKVHQLQQNTKDVRVRNLANVLLADFGRKTEVIISTAQTKDAA